jgi:3-isopropylmalate/(R)-2-methylmalate dehydratase small subunit
MESFKPYTARYAVLPVENIDTDQIIPARFLKTTSKVGLGEILFSDWRYNDDGTPNSTFVVNRPEYQGVEVLVAGNNFGCGSSREHAPWALEDYGFRAIIAPSFADIFYNNCFKNGLLPIALDADTVDALFKELTDDYALTIDLSAQTIATPSGKVIAFAVDENRKFRLLNGLDDIGLTLQQADKIHEYESQRAKRAPWLFTKNSI